MDEPRAGGDSGHPLEGKPTSFSARTPARQVSVSPETPGTPGDVKKVRRRHRTWEGSSSTKAMVAEQKELREREMLAEMGRGKSSTSITTKIASLLPYSLYSRHSSDSGFHSRSRGEVGVVDEKVRMGTGMQIGVENVKREDIKFLAADSRPPSLQVSRSASRAESLGSSFYSSECFEDEVEPSVRVVPGGNVNDSYRLGTLLGEGAFSKVYLAESLVEPGGLAAVKVIDKAELCKEEDKMFLVDKEIEIMSQLDHPHIIRLYEVYENESEVCLVMELAKGGELFDRLLEAGSLDEREAGRVMAQVLSAVADLHSRGIVHRDLKPENLLYYDNRAGSPLLVADFGLSEYEDQLSAMSPVCGTATYLAPEVISQTLSSRAQDLWSCGVIAYILLCGYPPFCKAEGDEGEESLLRQIVQGRLHFHPQFWNSVSHEAEDFVRRLLVADPGLRMTVEEAQHHPWIRSTNNCEPSIGCAKIFSSALLVVFVLTAIISLHLYLLTDYFDLETELMERAAQILCRVFSLLKKYSDFLIVIKSFFLDIRLFDQCIGN